MTMIRGLLGAIALAGLSCSAYAQAPPAGTYRQSCSNIRMQGSTLTAICRSGDGRGVQTALGVAGCVGDIGNNNGQLQCNGGQPSAYPQRGYGQAPGPGYPPSGYASPPGYGQGQGYGQGYSDQGQGYSDQAKATTTGTATATTKARVTGIAETG